MLSSFPGEAGFIGRGRELTKLATALDAASEGAGTIAMIGGEPGVGKTRLAEEFVSIARERGSTILWARCDESEWTRPYGPWVEAAGPMLHATHGNDRFDDDLERRPTTAEIVDLMGRRTAQAPVGALLDSSEGRFRLREAFRVLLSSNGVPTVLVLDDAQWMDSASIGLLQHIGRARRETNLAVVATFRSSELDPRGPLARCLGQLDREPRHIRLSLGPLTRTETGLLVASISGKRVERRLADAIHDETDGNPFFINELTRHLVDRGQNFESDIPLETIEIPETVREAVLVRLGDLSPEANRMLSMASAFTATFDFRMLAQITGLNDDILLDALDEALRSALLRVAADRPDSYTFNHAVIRHALYEELNPSRRARLHRRIATALQPLDVDQSIMSSEIAAHYYRSRSLPGAARGLDYALAAAAEAWRDYAFEEAARFLEIARVLGGQNPAAVRGEIDCRLALALAKAGRADDALEKIDEGIELLDGELDAMGLVERIEPVVWAIATSGVSERNVGSLAARALALLGDRRDLTWARLVLVDQRLRGQPIAGVSGGVWTSTDANAIAIARQSGNEETLAWALTTEKRPTREQTDALLGAARAWTAAAAKVRGLSHAALDLMTIHGAFRESSQVAAELIALAERVGSSLGLELGLMVLGGSQTALGEFDAGRATIDRAAGLSPHFERPISSLTLQSVESRYQEYVGGERLELVQALEALASDPNSGSPSGSTFLSEAALGYVRVGDPARAHRLISRLLPALVGIEPQFRITAVNTAAAVCWELRDEGSASTYLSLVHEQLAEGLHDLAPVCALLTVARMTALTAGRVQAASWFEAARATLDADGRRPLRAIVDFDESRAIGLTPGRERRAAIRLIDAAHDRFHELGMNPWEDAARAWRERLTGSRRLRPEDRLSRREREVLRLVVAGQTNRDIATALALSPRTVERHLLNAYSKIGAPNRAAAVSFAVRHGLAASTEVRGS